MLIGDLDAVNVFLDPIRSRQQYLQLRNSWERVSLEFDAVSTISRSINTTSLQNSLIESGYYYLAASQPSINDNYYECLWRLADWSVLQTENCGVDGGFEKYHYNALKSLKNRDELGMKTAIYNARQSIIDIWKHYSFECTESVYKNLLSLQQLQQIEDFSVIQFNRSEEVCKSILKKWDQQDKIATHDFKYKESILSQRASIFKTLGLQGSRIWTRISPEPLQNILLKIVSEARIVSNKNVSIRNLAILNSLELTKTTEARVLLEDSQLNWSLGDKNLAKKLAFHVATETEYNTTLSKVVALRLYGEFLAESRSENPIVIYKEFFKTSLNLLKKIDQNQSTLSDKIGLQHIDFVTFEKETRLEIYDSLAKYVDREYVQVSIVVVSINKYLIFN